jgi:hypothetical protein
MKSSFRHYSSICIYDDHSFHRYQHHRHFMCSCHHDMAHPLVADGGDGLQIWRVALNILNKQSRTAGKGRSSSLGEGALARG